LLLHKYNLGIKKDEKDLIKKIAARVGLSVTPEYGSAEYDTFQGIPGMPGTEGGKGGPTAAN
jgi:hypothetical protein